ncbi:MAG: winged helix-turn-helix transcriptional regulator [Promethearchaeota archaeon]
MDEGINKKKIFREFIVAFLITMSMATFSSRARSSHGYNSNDVLAQQTRHDIYKLIEENEGMHFRMICRKLDRKMGVVQYHISVLEKEGLIRSVKDGRYKCFFVTNKNRDPLVYRPYTELNQEQKKVRQNMVTSMRRVTPSNILTNLATHSKVSHQELAKLCNVSPQAITFHCQKLSNMGLIDSIKEGRQKYYTLTDAAKEILPYIDINN